MTARTTPSSPLRWPQILGLGLAGLASFGLAAYWNVASSNDADGLVQAVVRTRSTSETSAAPAAAQISLEALQPTGNQPLQMSARAENTNAQVTRNPFGNLNLLASVELAAGRNTGGALPTATVTKPRKPKAEPSPVVVAEAPPPPPPPPPPTAPVLPFTVVGGISGQQIAEGRPVVFLRQRDEVLVVRPGDEIDKTYRVETITLEKIEFTYLPLQQRQTLSMRP